MPTEIKHVTCGCCSNGCVCANHCDVPNGRPVKACQTHSVMPFAPLDPSFRWDAAKQDYVRVPRS